MLKKISSQRISLAVLVMLLVGLFTITGMVQARPKYIFYFVGDGLGSAHATLAEFYLQELGEGELNLIY